MPHIKRTLHAITLLILAILTAIITIIALGTEHPRLFFLLIVGVLALPFAFGMFCYWVIGAKNRDEGIICPECKGRAFPLDDTMRRYRCAVCHHQFDGPRHL